MAPPAPAAIEAPDLNGGLRIMDWLRNTRPGQLLTNVSMSAAVILPCGSIVGATLSEAPLAKAAEDAPALTDSQKQECINVAIEKPAIKEPFVMHNAGIRPSTGFGKPQVLRGAVDYEYMPKNCNDYIRISSVDAWLLRNGHRVSLSRNATGVSGAQGGVRRAFIGPGHADPCCNYLFNDCLPGQGFSEVKVGLYNKIKDVLTKEVIDEEEYILKAPVKGNCKTAEKSEIVMRHQWEKNYGIPFN